MIKLVRSAFGCWVIFVLIIIAARWLPTDHQPITLATWLTNAAGQPCDKPCVLGIEPGITSFDQALRLVKEHPLTHALPMYYADRSEVLFPGDDIPLGIIRDTDGLVYSIHLEPQRRDISVAKPGDPTLRLRLGDLINEIGLPNAFQLREGRFGPVDVSTYFAHNLVVIHHRRGATLSPFDPFIYIFMYRANAGNIFRPNAYSPTWRGFVHQRRYREQVINIAPLDSSGQRDD